MQRRRQPARQLHPALAALGALALHAAVWLTQRWMLSPLPPALSPPGEPAPIELSLTVEARTSSAAPAAATPAGTHSPASAARQLTKAGRVRELRAGETSASTGERAVSPAQLASGAAPARPIDLGLNGGVRRAALHAGALELPAQPARASDAALRPSDGGLRQGLLALDARRGLSRSAAAQHAAYGAARRYAPASGIASFDVTADERGVVLSVTLASAPVNHSQWQRVAEELQRLLMERRLRVPPGARGLVARLRIETGELALDGAERFRSRRGAALGQAPLHARELRSESTRSSLEPGQLTPTLGVTLAGSSGDGAGVRVVLLDERAL